MIKSLFDRILTTSPFSSLRFAAVNLGCTALGAILLRCSAVATKKRALHEGNQVAVPVLRVQPLHKNLGTVNWGNRKYER